MDALDLRSIGLTLSLSGFALTAVLWAAQRDGDEIAGLREWITSAATMSAGLGLSALQGIIPEWSARVLANTMLVAAPIAAWQGSRVFRGVPTNWSMLILASLWTLLWGIIFVYVWPSARLRIVLVSITMSVACFAAAVEFLRLSRVHVGPAARFGGLPLLAFGLMMAIRAVEAATREEVVSGALVPTPVNVATYMLGSVVLLCAIAGMVMSVSATRAAQIRELAYRDALTGALSRRGFYVSLSRWASSTTNSDSGATVALLDANGFKQINDALGHETGDRILQALVQACEHCLPSGCLIARFGGDEFVLLMPRSVDADIVLNQIATTFAADSEKLLGHKQTLPSPTIAFGTAVIGAVTPDTFDQSLRLADANMYQHKVRARSPQRAAAST